MIKMQIPDIGDSFTLAEDWTFILYSESRNSTLWKLVTGSPYQYDYRNPKKHECTLPKGTKLVVDRIYIRKGAKSFSSLTFRIVEHPQNKNYNKKRFWAKLSEVNKMMIENLEESTPTLSFSRVPSLKRGNFYHGYYGTNEYVPTIKTVKENVSIDVFKVHIKVSYETEKIRQNYGAGIIRNEKIQVITDVKYILTDMNDNELITVNSYESLKKEANRIFKEKNYEVIH